MSLVQEPAQDEWLIMLLVSILGATAYSVECHGYTVWPKADSLEKMITFDVCW